LKEIAKPMLSIFQALIMPSPDNIMKAIDSFKGVDIGKAFGKGFAEGVQGVKEGKKETTMSEAVKGSNAIGGAASVPSFTSKSEASKVTANKPTVINVHIGKLVEGLTIKVDHMEKGLDKMGEKVTQYIVSAINDATIIAGGI
jgi:hypothetical protein